MRTICMVAGCKQLIVNPKSNSKYCPEHKNRYNKEARAQYEVKRKEREQAAKVREEAERQMGYVKRIAALNEQAREMGLSYGQMVARG